MVQASPQDQKTLLALVDLDLELIRVRAEKAKLESGKEIELASAELFALSDSLIDARNQVGDLELELKRAEKDLELVEARIVKDKQRLATTSSPKDAQGIEHELTSLAKRKDELEDAELAILEKLEVVRINLQKAGDDKAASEQKLGSLREQLASGLELVAKRQAELINARQDLIRTINPELASAYQRKSERGVAAGRLSGRECGACRLAITATSIDEIVALPAQEVAECPNCQAYLVRA